MTSADSRPNVDYGPGDAARAGEILRSIVGSTVHGTAAHRRARGWAA